MWKQVFTLIAMVVGIIIPANSQSFTVTDADGHELRYTIIGNGELSVMAAQSPSQWTGSLNGSLLIPDSVYYDIWNMWLPVTEVPSMAFRGHSLSSVWIGRNVRFIGQQAFENNPIREITLFPSVDSIGPDAFTYVGEYGDSSSRRMSFHGTFEQWCGMKFANICSNPTVVVNQIDPNQYSPTFVIQIDTVAYWSWGDYAFVIPDTMRTIGNYIFENFPFSSIAFPDTMDYIGDGAFARCKKITSLDLKHIAHIGNDAFRGCLSLDSVTIDYNRSAYGSWFSGCDNVTYLNSNCGGTIGYTWMGMGTDNLRHLIVGPRHNMNTSYSNNGFPNRDSLRVVELNFNGYIPNSAFQHCDNLRTVRLGKGITEIKNHAFSACLALDTIYAFPAIPPTLNGQHVFEQTRPNKKVVVHCADVPYDSVWGTEGFVYLYEDVDPYAITLTVNNPEMGTVEGPDASCSQATIKAIPTTGYQFAEWSDGVTQHIRTITLVSDTSIEARFRGYTVRVQYGASGTDTAMGRVTGVGEYPAGATVELKAIPNSGYEFSQWILVRSNGNSTRYYDNPHTFNIYSNDYFIVFFTSTNNGMGNVENGELNVSVASGIIHVDGCDQCQVKVFDTKGRYVGDGSVALPAGAYMVQVNGKTTRKVVVVK